MRVAPNILTLFIFNVELGLFPRQDGIELDGNCFNFIINNQPLKVLLLYIILLVFEKL